MSPTEAVMGRKLRTTLDTLRPHNQQMQDTCDNKGQNFTVGTSVLVRNFRPGRPNWAPGTISKRKGKLVYNVQVREQLLARHKNQFRPRYTRNNIINYMPTISLDLLMDTFDLPSPSLPVQTNANGSRAEPRRKWPKWNCTKVQHLQINPKLDCSY